VLARDARRGRGAVDSRRPRHRGSVDLVGDLAAACRTPTASRPVPVVGPVAELARRWLAGAPVDLGAAEPTLAEQA
jgi:hypothetical protein